jgi:predicted permease
MAVGVDSVARALVGPARPALWLLLGAVLLVLLVAGANVASLELARGVRRVPELQVRAALGAEQRQIAWMLIIEGALLCIAACGVGIGLAAVAARGVVRLVPQPLPRLEDAGLDLRAILFALVVTLVVGALVLAAMIAGARRGADPRVVGSARVARAHGAWTRRLLVAGNLALAVALVHGAMLMTRTVTGLLRTETGFDSARVLSVQLTMLGPRYEEESSINLGIEQLLARVRALPGIESAAIASQVPLGGDFDGRGIEVEGRTYETAADMISLQRYSVTDTYLETMRVGLVLGRGFEGADRDGTEAVAILSESAAQSLFRDESPLGKRIRTGGSETPWRTVVGVVRDVRHVDLRTPALPSLYLPMAQFVDSFVTLVVRTSLPYDRQAEALRRTIAANLPDVPSYAVASLEDLERRAAGLERFTGWLLAAFAAIALLLAAIGLYGLIAYLVEARRREVGIRVALGAARSSVAWLVLRPGVGLALVGFVVGASAALVLARAFESLLYGVGPADPASLLLVAAALLAVALLAQVGPLRRALRLDPARALRADG